MEHAARPVLADHPCCPWPLHPARLLGSYHGPASISGKQLALVLTFATFHTVFSNPCQCTVVSFLPDFRHTISTTCVCQLVGVLSYLQGHELLQPNLVLHW